MVRTNMFGFCWMIYQPNDELLKSATNLSDSLNEMIVFLDNDFRDSEHTAKLCQFSNNKIIITMHQKPH